MKVKVIKKFKDKTTKDLKLRKVGEVIKVTKERFNELVKAGNYVEVVEEDKKEK